jgi:Rrf2 family transcriptional regulator, cysteine metabolism repressor
MSRSAEELVRFWSYFPVGARRRQRMWVTQKCQYALRALFELAKRQQEGIVRSTDIATCQAIPKRFLEVILHQLRQGGFVDSQRGKEGGFYLSRPAATISLGEIIRFIDGPINPVDCQRHGPLAACSLKGDCVFMALWDEARLALEQVYDTKTLQDLVDKEQAMLAARAPQYSI